MQDIHLEKERCPHKTVPHFRRCPQSEVSSFQKVSSIRGVLVSGVSSIREVSSFQECPLRGGPLYLYTTYQVSLVLLVGVGDGTGDEVVPALLQVFLHGVP